MTDEELFASALSARDRAYAPYSGFTVGAALLTNDGRVYLGANIENAAYSPSLCAERAAFAAAIVDGARDFAAIAVAGGKTGEAPTDECPPCGVCRQVMAEFCKESFRVLLGKSAASLSSYTLGELFPAAFSKDALA